MIVTLKPGETVRVELFETDGAFEISYGEIKDGLAAELTVTTEMPGSHVGKEGVIYREIFAGCTCREFGRKIVGIRGKPDRYGIDRKCPTHGEFGTAHTKPVKE